MAAVRSGDTGPERRVRSAAHALGLRFRLHRRDLPGTPDLIFPKHRTVVFVHGCFWHRHPGCRKATMPKSREAFWRAKFERNVERDLQVTAALLRLGWRVQTFWECETRNSDELRLRLVRSFGLEQET